MKGFADKMKGFADGMKGFADKMKGFADKMKGSEGGMKGLEDRMKGLDGADARVSALLVGCLKERCVYYFLITRPVCRGFWPRMGHGLLARPLLSVLMA